MNALTIQRETQTTDGGMEQLGYVKALDGSPLYAAYHPAAAAANTHSRFFPVVIAPPLFEERKSAYSSLRRLAVALAAAGHAVLRFDYRGSGESGGAPAKRRWQNLAEDVATARKTLARLTGKRDSVLLGLRLGGTLALQETIRAGGEGVVALAPIIKGAAQVRMWKMRSKIRADMTNDTATAGRGDGGKPGHGDVSEQTNAILDFDGFEVSQAFFDDVAKIDLVKDLGRLSCPGLVMQLSHRTDAAAETEQLIHTLGSCAKLKCLRVEPFWDKLDDVDTTAMEEEVIKAVSGF